MKKPFKRRAIVLPWSSYGVECQQFHIGLVLLLIITSLSSESHSKNIASSESHSKIKL